MKKILNLNYALIIFILILLGIKVASLIYNITNNIY